MKEKSHVEDIDRSVYDIRDEEKDAYRLEEGLTADIVEKLSKEKHDPEWMREFRLKSLEVYNNMKVPDWGPSIDGLDMDHIATYVKPKTEMKGSWEEVPEDIKNTFVQFIYCMIFHGNPPFPRCFHSIFLIIIPFPISF